MVTLAEARKGDQLEADYRHKTGNPRGVRLGGSTGSVYGDVTAAEWLPVVAWPSGS